MAAEVHAISHHNQKSKYGASAACVAELGVHDAVDMMHKIHDLGGANHGSIGNIEIGGASAGGAAGSADLVLEQIEQGVGCLLAMQRTARWEADIKFKALEEQGKALAMQVRALRIQMADAKAVEQDEHVEDEHSEPEDLFENGVDSSDAHKARFLDKRVTSPNESESRTRSPRHPLRKGSSVVFIAEACTKEDSQLPKEAEEPRWRSIIHSVQFDLIVGAIIVANTMVMSLELEYLGNKLERNFILCDRPPCGSDWSWPWAEDAFQNLEHIFTAFFVAELTMRLAADGFSYLRSFANACDAAIVLVSSADSWVITPLMTSASGSSGGTSNVAILRLVRLVRLSKVFRVVRVMKAFKSLRVLVSAVAASVGALAWSMTLLFVLELMGAIFLSQVLRPFIEEPERDPESRKFLWERFGTWVRAMLTVFEITMAPGGFMQYRRVAEEVHPIFGLIIAVYVCLVTFAVVRVITAMFLKATLSVCDQDEARVAYDKAHSREMYAHRLKQALRAEGEDDNVDESELRQLLEIEKMKDWLEEVELHPQDAERLFRALGRAEHGDGRASFSEFVAALQRMRGPPRAADSIVTLMESRWILERLTVIEEAMTRQYGAAPLPPVRVEKRSSVRNMSFVSGLGLDSDPASGRR